MMRYEEGADTSADTRNHPRQHVHAGLKLMGKLDDPMFGNVPPDDTVKLVFNLSQGEDKRGPWNEATDSNTLRTRSRKAECHPRQ